jgi:hypothetical protein
MMFRLVTAVTLAAGIVLTSNAQTISFNSPLPWVSLRNDTIIVRAQIDTAALKGKELSMSLMIAEKGKASNISTKKFKLTDPSGEFSFGKINKNLVGGEAYMKIKWNIVGKAIKGKDGKVENEEKGEIEPIGIADLTTIKTADTLHAVHVADNASPSDIAAKAAEKMTQLGTTSFSLAWNKTKFFIIVKKSTDGDTLKVALDGKCGKNAFLSFPDRTIVAVLSDSLSVNGIHFEREINNNSLIYNKKEWQNEITKEIIGDNIVISMPWFDTGIIPFEERTIGTAIFTIKTGAKTVSAIPETAKFFIPATWGITLLQK